MIGLRRIMNSKTVQEWMDICEMLPADLVEWAKEEVARELLKEMIDNG